MELRVQLSNSKEQHILNYEVFSSPVTELWCKSLKQAEALELGEKDRFYNFPRNQGRTLEDLLGHLENVIGQLQALHPELRLNDLDAQNLQVSVNHLHTHFAHSHLVEAKITDQNRELWRDFNTLLHAVEAWLINLRHRASLNLPLARIVFTWPDNFRQELPEEAYSHFSLRKEFGGLYANYSQVGRQLVELYYAEDQNVPIEHVQPARFLSADSMLWFGPTTTDEVHFNLLNGLESWFHQHPTLMSTDLKWGDPKLALGYLPLGRLKQNFNSDEERLKYVEFLGQFNEISFVKLIS